MPNIRQYQAPALGLQPNETGVSAAVNAGRSIARSYDEAASATTAVGNDLARNVASTVKDVGDQVVKFVEHREISHGAAAFAELNEKLTQDWNNRAKSADPNDPTVAAKFREETLEPALEKYRESFLTEGGQNFAERHSQSLRTHMYEKSSADMATLAANAVAVNVRQTGNSLSNTAVNDPSAVPHLLSSVDTMVGGMIDSAPNLKGAVAAKARLELSQKMRESIVKSGAIGAIEKSADPEATAQAWGAKYPEYINGDELRMLSANARQQIRARRADDNNSRVLQDREVQRKSDARETEYLQKLYSDDPKEMSQVSTKAIVNDPSLNRVAKERMIGVVNREFKPETATQASNTNAMDLLQRIRAPDDSPDRITDLKELYDARINGKLNRADFEMLRKEFADVRTPEGERLSRSIDNLMKAVKPSIDKSNPLQGKIFPDESLNFYRYEMDVQRKVAEYRKGGKNPYDLFDPSKPEFVGRPEALLPYQKTMSQTATDNARRMLQSTGSKNLTGNGSTITGIEVTPAPKIIPRKPGESPADYLKRTGS